MWLTTVQTCTIGRREAFFECSQGNAAILKDQCVGTVDQPSVQQADNVGMAYNVQDSYLCQSIVLVACRCKGFHGTRSAVLLSCGPANDAEGTLTDYRTYRVGRCKLCCYLLLAVTPHLSESSQQQPIGVPRNCWSNQRCKGMRHCPSPGGCRNGRCGNSGRCRPNWRKTPAQLWRETQPQHLSPGRHSCNAQAYNDKQHGARTLFEDPYKVKQHGARALQTSKSEMLL